MGAVHRACDRIGAHLAANPVTSGDLAAILVWQFGLDPETEIEDLTGRPYWLVDGGLLHELFG